MSRQPTPGDFMRHNAHMETLGRRLKECRRIRDRDAIAKAEAEIEVAWLKWARMTIACELKPKRAFPVPNEFLSWVDIRRVLDLTRGKSKTPKQNDLLTIREYNDYHRHIMSVWGANASSVAVLLWVVVVLERNGHHDEARPVRESLTTEWDVAIPPELALLNEKEIDDAALRISLPRDTIPIWMITGDPIPEDVLRAHEDEAREFVPDAGFTHDPDDDDDDDDEAAESIRSMIKGIG